MAGPNPASHSIGFCCPGNSTDTAQCWRSTKEKEHRQQLQGWSGMCNFLIEQKIWALTKLFM
jgi:hypothetical protein